ncbi:1-acyl-sn-glycerol-3-phosphate acyltransferase [Patescibacteria group bacterium]|nr:1-acyl-sn-glycerol-3-phosphate acyltransferase [Patescibacteria group bacterium]
MRDFLAKIVQRSMWSPGRVLFRFFLHFEVQGNPKGLPDSFLIVANHGSWLDPFFIGGALPPKYLPFFFATWHKYYKNPFLFPFVFLMGCFPVKKGEGLANTLQYPLHILENGGRVVIFPEGKRHHLGRPRKGRRGAAWLALRTKTHILPVYITGNVGLTIWRFLGRSQHIKVRIGEKFSLPSFDLSDDIASLNTASEVILSKLGEVRG